MPKMALSFLFFIFRYLRSVVQPYYKMYIFEAVLIPNIARSATRTLDQTCTYILYFILLRFFLLCLHLHILFVIVTQTVHLHKYMY